MAKATQKVTKIKKDKIILKAPCVRMLQRGGAERVSESAAQAFAEVLEEIALTISEQAVRIAEHSGRKTVKGGDVKLAART
jgi:DNA-binding protein